LRQGCPAADNPATRPLIEGSRLAHILDLAETEYTVTRSAAELDAARTLLCVPLRRDGRLLGMIASARREVRPFSDKEIALLENFAAQAVNERGAQGHQPLDLRLAAGAGYLD
jgi:GAF domain-containing protein